MASLHHRYGQQVYLEQGDGRLVGSNLVGDLPAVLQVHSIAEVAGTATIAFGIPCGPGLLTVVDHTEFDRVLIEGAVHLRFWQIAQIPCVLFSRIREIARFEQIGDSRICHAVVYSIGIRPDDAWPLTSV